MRAAIMSGFALMCAGAASAGVAGEDPQPPYVDQSAANGTRPLSGWIETSLQAMTSTCTQQAGPLRLTRWASNQTRPATTVPPTMQRALDLNNPVQRRVKVEEGAGVSRIFDTVYTGASLTDPAATVSHLVLPSQDGAAPMPGVDLIAYESDCVSSLSAALNGSSDFTLPVLTLKAALNASYTNSGTYRLSLVGGHFVSPLRRTLAPQDPGPSALPLFPTALALWLWYREQPGRRGQTHWVVDSFDGFALFSQYDSNTAVSVGGSGSGSGRALGMAGDANAQTSAFMNSRLAARLYTVAYDLGPNNVAIRAPYALPTAERAAELAAAHGLMALDVEHSDSSELLDSRPVRLRHTMSGLPQSECAPTYWRTSDPAVTLEDVTYDDKARGCAFSSTYAPTPAIVGDGGRLQYTYIRPFGVAGGPDLTLRTPAIHFTASRAPALRWNGGDAQAVVGTRDPVGLTPLTWTRQYTLVDRTGAQIVTAIEPENVQIACASGARPASATASITSGSGTDRTVTLVVRHSSALAMDGGTVMESCEAQGALVYVLQNGNRIRKTLPAGYVVYSPAPPPPAPVLQGSSPPG